MSDVDPREELLDIIALLREVDRKFNQLGFHQHMSVGPSLTQLRELETEVVKRGKGYGVLPKSANLTELQVNARHERTVDVNRHEPPEMAGDTDE